jgi:hypothetical protein
MQKQIKNYMRSKFKGQFFVAQKTKLWFAKQDFDRSSGVP